ncbi:MAG: hypothetical protein M1831_007133 [Alyxoria varia]|nr:MAG: hypothetical protein M1831_007133 [Alyxoria varia]
MPRFVRAQYGPVIQPREDVSRNQEDLRGWVQAPDKRGTIDIIWSSASTVFVCVWVMLHLNVPAKKDSQIVQFLRRLKWFILALLAPELIMLFAGGQWASAQRSTQAMANLGAEDWSLVHAFYADSGGFMLQAPDSVEFPVTAQQIHYLVEKKYIPIPNITRNEIWDKSKADLFAKFVAVLQSGWFVIQIVARAIQGLPISLLELSNHNINVLYRGNDVLLVS